MKHLRNSMLQQHATSACFERPQGIPDWSSWYEQVVKSTAHTECMQHTQTGLESFAASLAYPAVCPCHEQVMENTVRWMHRAVGQQVYRARFSAITAPEIKAAMVCSKLFACAGPVMPLNGLPQIAVLHDEPGLSMQAHTIHPHWVTFV